MARDSNRLGTSQHALRPGYETSARESAGVRIQDYVAAANASGAASNKGSDGGNVGSSRGGGGEVSPKDDGPLHGSHDAPPEEGGSQDLGVREGGLGPLDEQGTTWGEAFVNETKRWQQQENYVRPRQRPPARSATGSRPEGGSPKAHWVMKSKEEFLEMANSPSSTVELALLEVLCDIRDTLIDMGNRSEDWRFEPPEVRK